MKVLFSSILAGICVGFGGLAYLSVDNKLTGAALFTIGLFVICTFGLYLFTGKVCYVLQNDRKYARNLPVIWLGNLIGTGLTAGCASLTRLELTEKAQALCAVKLSDNLVSLFFLGILCNICIYFAVEGYARNPHELGKYLSVFFGVMVFIMIGAEHCVADMFYFWMAGMWNLRAVVTLLVITLGNATGGILFAELKRRI